MSPARRVTTSSASDTLCYCPSLNGQRCVWCDANVSYVDAVRSVLAAQGANQ